MRARRFNFTQRAVAALAAPKTGREVYGDAGEQGLTVTVTAAGSRYFSWYRKVRAYPTWKAIGPYPELSVEDARLRAKEMSAAVARWKADGYKGPNPLERHDEITLDRLVDEYVARHLKHHAKNSAKAAKDVRWMIAKYAAPFRQRKLDAIRHEDIRALFRKIGAKHERTANSVKELFVRLFNFAIREKLFAENPALGIRGYHNVKRERFLEPSELPLLWTALRRSGNLDLQHFVNIALFSAVRKSDILSAKWADVSLPDRKWVIPNPKSRTPYVVPISDELFEIFRERERNRLTGTDWIFPSRAGTKSGHLADMKRAWRTLLADAGLDYKNNPELRPRIHDLRRTQGANLATLNVSSTIIGKALGHAPGSSATAVYARMNLDPVRAAMESANAAISAAMRKKPKLLLPARAERKKAAGRG